MKLPVLFEEQVNTALRYHLETVGQLQPQPGPEVGVVQFVADNIIMLPRRGGTLALKCCDVRQVRMVNGLLPATIQQVILGEGLTWEGPVEQYLVGLITMEVNGHSKITAVKYLPTPEPIMKSAGLEYAMVLNEVRNKNIQRALGYR